MKSNYVKLLSIVLPVNTTVMFFITYLLIDTSEHFYANLNRIYMAIVMVTPMMIVMMAVMSSMYRNSILNVLLYTIFSSVFIAGVFIARTQTFISNEQFLRSMIPHHSSAILMCERAALTDQEILGLCSQIIDSQMREINQMKQILKRY